MSTNGLLQDDEHGILIPYYDAISAIADTESVKLTKSKSVVNTTTARQSAASSITTTATSSSVQTDNKNSNQISPPEERKACARSLLGRAQQILLTADIAEKVRETEKLSRDWKSGNVNEIVSNSETISPPDHPSRPPHIEIVGNGKVKQGSRVSFIHGVAHAESYAIDLMWDMICRFHEKENMPKEFLDDWVRVAGEEALHYSRWNDRLKQLGSYYGELPTHESLWDSASETSDSLYARLAVVHMVHEARGLDVAGVGLNRLRSMGDTDSAQILISNVRDEITHVGAAVKWFTYLCQRDGKDPITAFHDIVRSRFKGFLKPPFDKEARLEAGMTEPWYLPLAKR